MQTMIFTLFLKGLISIGISVLLSHLIDFLYSLPNAPLSFQKKTQHRTSRIFFLSVMLLVALIYCENFSLLMTIYKMIAAIFLLVITVTDFEQYVIFDIVLIPFALIGIVFAFVLELSLVERFLAAFFGGIAFFSLMILTKNGIGGGDVKLVAALGLWLGTDILSTLLNAAILGGICALFLLVAGLKSRTDYFAYGPYFCIAASWSLFH